MSKLIASVSKIRLFFLILFVGLILIFLERFGALDFAKGVVSYLSTPIQLSVYRSYQNLSQSLDAVVSIGGLHARNSTLERENALLLAENIKIRSLEKENENLRAQLGSPKIGLKLKEIASVIGFGVGGNRDSLLLDQGQNQKIKKGDLVVVRNIFVGTVVEVSPRTSRVALITDPQTKIPAITQSGAVGVLAGQFGTEAHLTNVIQDDKLNEGELVLTSGEADYPKNLVLGKITSVKKVSRELFQNAKVESLLPAGELQTVFVMERK
ncbi:MAG: rod shape-determining protein MreC [bacterium]|nr:rod shape-determining protein MreC [bacterium]